MKRLYFIALMFIVFKIHAQRPIELNDYQVKIDSLKNIISYSKSDSLKCVLNFGLAEMYIKNLYNKQLGLVYLKTANQLSKNNIYLNDLSYYYNNLNLNLKKENLLKFREADEKLKKYENAHIYTLRTKILFNIALIYQRENEPLKTLKILTEEAIPVVKKSKNKQELSNIYKLISVVFYNNEDLIKTTYYLDLAIDTLRKSKNKENQFYEDLIELYLFKVEVLSVQKNINEAVEFLNKAEILLKSYPLKSLYIEYYFSKGSLNMELNNYNAAILDFNKGIEFAQTKNDTLSSLRFKLMKFDVLLIQNKLIEAKDLILDLLKKNELNIKDKTLYSYELSKIYKKLNDLPNAIKYSELHISLKDSLSTMFEKNQVRDLEAKFNKLENENKIKILKKEKQNAELIAKNNRLYYLVFVILSGILILILGFLWKNYNNQKKINFQTDVIHKQKLINLKNQKDVEVMQALIDGEELERKRVARDLHDSIGSKLSSLKILFSRVSIDKIKKDDIENFEILLTDSIDELRQVSYNLVPESLLKLGLENAINDLCFTLNSKEIKIECQIFGLKNDLSESVQTNIFRIVQELINNAFKHSKCTEILVSCSQNKSAFLISVEDNGIGFNSKELYKMNGLGLKNIKNRVDILNGCFNCHSDSKGTSINIELEV